MNKKGYLWGATAGSVFILTVYLGGYFWPDFTVYQAISQLTLPTSPHHTLTLVLFALFNCCLFLYGRALASSFRRRPFLRLTGQLLIISALAGLLMTPFPMDPVGSGTTIYGVTHRTLATISVIGLALSVPISGIGFGKIKKLNFLRRRAFYFSGLILTAGLGIVIAAILQSLSFGFYERVTVGALMLWLIWSSLQLWRLNA